MLLELAPPRAPRREEEATPPRAAAALRGRLREDNSGITREAAVAAGGARRRRGEDAAGGGGGAAALAARGDSRCTARVSTEGRLTIELSGMSSSLLMSHLPVAAAAAHDAVLTQTYREVRRALPVQGAVQQRLGPGDLKPKTSS
jgi:hypothetical protein